MRALLFSRREVLLRERSVVALMQQRYYDPLTGEFISVDPDTSSFNRYSYALSNPYRFTDPDGRKADGGGTSAQVNCDAECQERRRQEEERKKKEAEALKRARAVIAEIQRQLRRNPSAPVTLTKEQLRALAEQMRIQVREEEARFRSFAQMSLYDFMQSMVTADSVFLQFQQAGATFQIEGFGGTHNASDINYLMVGMVTAAADRPAPLLHGMVVAWNVGQATRGALRGDVNSIVHNVRQIPPSMAWATVGFNSFEPKR